MQYYYGGAPYHPGTSLPNNVTGECPHKHKTPGAAQRCIDDMTRSMREGHGPAAYCDRVVMVAEAVRERGTGRWLQVGSAEVWTK